MERISWGAIQKTYICRRYAAMTDTFTEKAFDPESRSWKMRYAEPYMTSENDKASGCDGIPIELELHWALSSIGIELQQSSRRRRNTGTNCAVPEYLGNWNMAKGLEKNQSILPIPKKTDPRVCANKQTIALVSYANKVMLKIIKARMEMYVEPEMPDD